MFFKFGKYWLSFIEEFVFVSFNLIVLDFFNIILIVLLILVFKFVKLVLMLVLFLVFIIKLNIILLLLFVLGLILVCVFILILNLWNGFLKLFEDGKFIELNGFFFFEKGVLFEKGVFEVKGLLEKVSDENGLFLKGEFKVFLELNVFFILVVMLL